MDDQVVRKLTRQLKWLNFWVTFFGVLFLIVFVVAGFFLYKAYTELHKAENNLTVIQQKAQSNLDLQTKLCGNTGTLSTLLKQQTTVCD